MENNQTSNTNKIFAHAFNLSVEIGPVRLMRILNHFTNLERAWKALSESLRIAQLPNPKFNSVYEKLKTINPQKEYEKLIKAKITPILITEAAYPTALKEIAHPPPLIYMRGKVDALKPPKVAIVGSRKITEYGRQAVADIVSGLSGTGLAIVSGLAFGTDAEALKNAAELGFACVAVLASSIDDNSITPRENFRLAQKILENGCLLSEYPLGSTVQKQNFPVRNRIISGLSAATVVIEADMESGALITAKYALEQNRLIFALPGSIYSPLSLGTNDLIKRGAFALTKSSDIIEGLNLDLIEVESAVNVKADSDQEAAVLNFIQRQPVHVDEIVKSSGLTASETNSVLSLLELKGRIKNLGQGRYVKIR